MPDETHRDESEQATPRGESEQRALQDHSQAEINRLHAAGMCYLSGHDTERSVKIGDELHLLCEDCDPVVA